MKQLTNYAALAIAVVALVLAIRASMRTSSVAPAAKADCVDQQARERLDAMSRTLAERELAIARLTSSLANAGSAGTSATPALPQGSDGIVHFAHIESPNPAVTVTQKADGSYDIRTTDPKLSGQIIVVTAVTATGEEQKLNVRVP